MHIKFYAEAIRKGDDPEAVLRVALGQQREAFIADIESSRPIRDDEPYRIGMHAGLDRAIYRIQHERLDADA